MRRYVFVTDELPRPGAAGHLALNSAIITWLRGLGHEVVVLLVGARLAGPVARYALAPVAGPNVWKLAGNWLAASPGIAPRVLARAALQCLPAGAGAWVRGANQGADAVLGRFMSPEDARWCARYIARNRFDAVLIDTIFRARLLTEPEMAEANSVLIAHDVFHRRHLALVSAGYSVQPAQLTRADEAAWARRARHIAAIQPDEAGLLAAMCPQQNVFVACMPALPCPPPPRRAPIPKRLVFVGSAALPNLDGLRWFLAEVWPHLGGVGVTLDLIGDCGAAFHHLPAGVARLGRVADFAPHLHGAALAIAPLRVGSGLKIKLLDYARHGLCTVATNASLAGFARDTAAPFIAADSAGQFARAVLQQLAAPAAPERALAYVARHYGVAASFKGLASAIAA